MIEVDSYKILPLDPNIPNPFSTGYKCHPPSGKYIGKKKMWCIWIFETISEYLDWLYMRKWMKEETK